MNSGLKQEGRRIVLLLSWLRNTMIGIFEIRSKELIEVVEKPLKLCTTYICLI